MWNMVSLAKGDLGEFRSRATVKPPGDKKRIMNIQSRGRREMSNDEGRNSVCLYQKAKVTAIPTLDIGNSLLDIGYSFF